MTTKTSRQPGDESGDRNASLTKRVEARVAALRVAGNKKERERRSLGRVFHELGDTHRQYREQTGQRVSPGLKQAAGEFKKEQSIVTLVAVAAFLDADGLLAW